MLTKNDRQQLLQDFKEVFITKDDLTAMEGRQGKKFTTKTDLSSQLLPIKKTLNTIERDVRQIKKTLNMAIKFTDDETKLIKDRVKRVENHLGLQPVIS